MKSKTLTAVLLELAVLAACALAASALGGYLALQRGVISYWHILIPALCGVLLWAVLRLMQRFIWKKRGRLLLAALWLAGVFSILSIVISEPPCLGARLPGEGETAGDLRLKVYDAWRAETRAGRPLMLEEGITLPALIPPGGRLEFGLGLEQRVSPAQRLVLEITAHDALGIRHPVAEIEIAGDKPCWRDYTVDLSLWSGQRVDLLMRLRRRDISGRGREAPAVWLSKPRIKGGDDRRPNILLLVLDTLRADHFSGDLNYPGVTPQMARWAYRGAWFRRHYAQCSWTLPSVASLLTSRMPGHTGALDINHFSLPGDNLTIAEILHEAGYRTIAVSANLMIGPDNLFDQGFDIFCMAKSKLRYCLDSGERLNQEVLALVKGVAAGPFLLFIQYIDPHLPYLPPGDYRAEFIQDIGILTKLRATLSSFNKALAWTYTRPSPSLVQVNSRLYQAEVLYLDSVVGRLLEALGQKGLLSNTIIIITSDHGEEWKEHGLTGHGTSLYEELLRVPLVIIDGRAPRTNPLFVDSITQNLDLVPTILEYAGLSIPQGMLGRSLIPLMHGLGPTGPNRAFAELPRIIYYQDQERKYRPGQENALLRAAIEGDKKLIEYIDLETGRTWFEAFYLKDDPQEQQSLAASPPPWVVQLREEMQDFFAQAPLRRIPATETAADEQTKKFLRSLGYTR